MDPMKLLAIAGAGVALFLLAGAVLAVAMCAVCWLSHRLEKDDEHD